MEDLKLLITVKTYPIPSAKYDELVCTAGVTESGDFLRLYPINFRDLPFSQQYKKYQWIRVRAKKHAGRDARKESYRPDCSTLGMIGEPVPANPGNWLQHKYALANGAASIEDLAERQAADRTSLGVLRPKNIHNLVITPDAGEWRPGFLQALRQARLWDSRKVTKEPPRKVPFKFHYRFDCDDPRCTRGHQMMIEDWEVGASIGRSLTTAHRPTTRPRPFVTSSWNKSARRRTTRTSSSEPSWHTAKAGSYSGSSTRRRASHCLPRMRPFDCSIEGSGFRSERTLRSEFASTWSRPGPKGRNSTAQGNALGGESPGVD